VTAQFKIVPGFPPFPPNNYTGLEYELFYDPNELTFVNIALDLPAPPVIPNGAFLVSISAVNLIAGVIQVSHQGLAIPIGNINAIGFNDKFSFQVAAMLLDDELFDVKIIPKQYLVAGGPNVAWNNVPDDFEVQKVPAPLPLLGVGAMFSAARRLRRKSRQLKKI